MKSFIHFLTLLITVSLGIRTAHAIPITFEAILTGANEVPPVVWPATGLAIANALRASVDVGAISK